MHYYKKNIGDYHRKAGRLSILQHGTYTLLMDSCYDREQFPTHDQALDWVWASSKDEIEAVEFVLRKFFTEIEGVFIQSRIKEEIDRYQANAVINKRIAMEREAKRKGNSTERAKPVNGAPPNQEPLTTNYEKDTTAHPADDANSGDGEKKSKKTRNDYPKEFEETWKIYPGREGQNPKTRSFKAWNARIKAGDSPEDIYRGVQRYANYIRKKGWEHTEHVQQSATFFGPDKGYNESWGISAEVLSKSKTLPDWGKIPYEEISLSDWAIRHGYPVRERGERLEDYKARLQPFVDERLQTE
ncbi:MAG: YdaU family protein [Desulfuromonadales bacterium]|nr:YdaU family protein [Desulfuromonadales bacterium]